MSGLIAAEHLARYWLAADLASGLAARGLIDEYRFMVNPIALGTGKPVLQGLGSDLGLELLRTRTFKNGNVLLCYAPRG